MINHHHRVHTKPGPVMSHSPLPMAASDRFCWNSHRVPEAYTGSTCSSIRHLTESSAFHHGKPGWCPHSLLPVFRTLNVNQIRLSPKKSIPEMEMQVEKKNIGLREMFPTIRQQNMAIIKRDKASNRRHSVEQKWPSPSGRVSGKNIFGLFFLCFPTFFRIRPTGLRSE